VHENQERETQKIHINKGEDELNPIASSPIPAPANETQTQKYNALCRMKGN